MADDDWTMGSLAAQDQYSAFPVSSNVEDRRPTSLHDFTAREPVLVPGYTEPVKGWGDMIEKNALALDARDMTFGQPDKYGFAQSIEELQQIGAPRQFPHPAQVSPVDQFEGRLVRQENQLEFERMLEQALKRTPMPQRELPPMRKYTPEELNDMVRDLTFDKPDFPPNELPVDPNATPMSEEEMREILRGH